MRRALAAFAVGLVTVLGALLFVFLRGEDTRERVRVVERRVTVDPCKRPKSDACQRRIRLVLRELVRRHPDVLKDLNLKVPESVSRARPDSYPGGGGATGPPQGGGPVGRVRPPVERPAPPPTPTPRPPHPEPMPEPLLDVEVPRVCVGDLVRVNCD